MVTCKCCRGRLMSPEHLAQVLRQLRDDARRVAPEFEPNLDPLLRLQAEGDYLDVGIEQVVSELDGVCSAYFFDEYAENEPKRWSN